MTKGYMSDDERRKIEEELGDRFTVEDEKCPHPTSIWTVLIVLIVFAFLAYVATIVGGR